MRKALFLASIFVLFIIFHLGMFHLLFENNIIENKVFIIPRGANIEKISNILYDAGIKNSHPILLKLLLFIFYITDNDHTIKSGEYKISQNSSLWLVSKKIISGDVLMRNFVATEGDSNFQIIKKLNDEKTLFGEINEDVLLNSGYNPNCITEITDNCYLFPDTYKFTYGINKQTIFDMMIKKGSKTIDLVWQNNKNPALKSKNELLVLASIIEKETSIADEMPQISGVFTNRLMKKIKLQADPTVIYSITNGKYVLDRPLSKADLKIQSMYNTYYIYGLPTKAVCNPGINALNAAANPLKTNALYFVASGDKRHTFANNINEHIKNIRKNDD